MYIYMYQQLIIILKSSIMYIILFNYLIIYQIEFHYTWLCNYLLQIYDCLQYLTILLRVSFDVLSILFINRICEYISISVTVPASFLGCTIYSVNCHISQLLVSASNSQHPFLCSKNSKDIYRKYQHVSKRHLHN